VKNYEPTNNPSHQHRVELVRDLMYKGCEVHWKCTKCGICIPNHCFKKDQIENFECEVAKNESTN